MNDTAMNETTIPEQPLEPETNQPVPALGARLAAEREAKGWSIEQVATQLNLAPRQIQALERDDYAALPGMASVRGFIRAYAKLLKLDAAPLIATISPKTVAPNETIIVRRALPSTPFSDNRSLSSRRRSLPSKLFMAALALLVVLAIVFVGEQMGWPPGIPHPLTAALKGLGALPAAEPVVSPVATVAQSDDASALAADPIAAAPTPAAPERTAVVSVPETAPVAIASDKPSPPVNDGLVLKLREDSWVEIKLANNSVLISRLVKAGTTESFKITGPVSLTLGNAAGVDTSLRGAPVDLKSATKNNVARLNLK